MSWLVGVLSRVLADPGVRAALIALSVALLAAVCAAVVLQGELAVGRLFGLK